MVLTDVQCRLAEACDKAYALNDGADGLYLWVTPTGYKSWRRDYSLRGRRSTHVLGPYLPAGAAAGATAERAGAEGGGVIDDPAVAQTLGAEPEAQYQKRIYDEYTAAKAKAGESVQNLSPERFGERLTRNAESLQKKHGVRLVRFIVEVNGGVVALKPVLIR